MTAASAAECALAKPGYRLDKTGPSIVAVECGAGFYSEGGDITSCTPCPEGTTTASLGGAFTLLDCQAKPGWGYNGGSVAICPEGTYKFALGGFDCVSCGSGLTTNGTGATSYNDCYIRTGWGATVVTYEPFLLSATRCLTGTFGATSPVFGPRSTAYACGKCPLFMTTIDTEPSVLANATLLAEVVNAGPTACLTLPDYGYNATTNTAYLCDPGLNQTSAGYNRDPCTVSP